MTKKKVQYPIHKTGKHCGYQVKEDGSIIVALTYATQMDEIVAEETAITTLLSHVLSDLKVRQQRVQADKMQWWQEVTDDYSLDLEISYSYSANSRTIAITQAES